MTRSASGGAAQRSDFGDLAASGEQRRIGFLAPCGDDAGDIGAGARRQRLQFRQPFRRFALAQIEFDEQSAITAWRGMRESAVSCYALVGNDADKKAGSASPI